jgi:cell division protein FtsZ
MIEFEPVMEITQVVSIKVVGVGGAGGNTVNSMIDVGYEGIEFIVANTDAQALMLSRAPERIQIGIKSTKGLGTGANPDIGKRAAEEDLDKILEVIGDAEIVFLTAGMGGGTGSGALPVIAKALKEKGILTIAIITKPFLFEGKRRGNVALSAIEHVKQAVDTLIVIPNQRLLDVVDEHVSMIEAFGMINTVLSQSVRGISEIITKPGHINVDYADVRTIMKDCGIAVMGTGKAAGTDRARVATMQAISSPLLENMSIEGARGVLFNITGGPNLSLHEINNAASIIYEQAHEDANIILGSVIDEQLTDEVSVTIIATGFEKQREANNTVSRAVLEKTPHYHTAAIKQQKAEVAAPNVLQSQEQEVIQEEKQEAAVVEDLDVPTFLRKKIEEQQV